MGELIRICAWCNIDLDNLRGKKREKVDGEDTISHGLCKKCAKQYLDMSDEDLEGTEEEFLSNDTIVPIALMRLTQIEDPDELLKDFNKENIIIEEKLDGWKTQIINSNGIIKIYSRKGEDKTENFPNLIKHLSFLPKNTMVEGELVYWENGKQEESKVTSIAGSSPENSIEKQKELPGEMKIHLYDILWLHGKNISKEPFGNRRKLLEKIVKQSDYIKITKQYDFDNWQDAMNEAVESGGEGIVLKIKNESYEYKDLGENEPKPKGVMYKYKGGIGKSETDDYVIFDYDISEKGNLKAFFGQYYKGKLYYISDISNFSEENEEKIKNKLKDGHFVVELGFQERLPGGLRHQKFIRFREDKSPKDATMNEFHAKNIDNFEIVKNASLFSYAGFIEDMIRKLEKDPEIIENTRIGLRNVPGVDVQKAYQIFSKLESGHSFIVGDSGTSFGKTQVQLGSFLDAAASDPNVQRVTGLAPSELRSFSDEWAKQKNILSGENWRRKVSVDRNQVISFMRRNPDKVKSRREGKIIRMFPNGQPGVVRIVKDKIVAEILDLNVLNRLGMKTSSSAVMEKVNAIMNQFVTWAVVRNSLARVLAYQKMPKTHDRIMNTFSSKNVNKNPELLSLTDRISQANLIGKIQAVSEAVRRYGYNTNEPGAYNIYQLIAISNAGGVGAVESFLKNKSPFAPGYLTYLDRANLEIEKITGIPTKMPPNGGIGGFISAHASNKSEILKEASYSEPGFLYFPAQYAADIKSGKRKITIRANDVPVEVSEIVRCVTYSGSPICDVRINSKNRMSIGRIEKAYGKRMARSLERQFGEKGQFTVIKFEPWSVSYADDKDEEKWKEVLIDKYDVKLTRQQIKDYYLKPSVRKKIMDRIKDKQILIYIGIERNESILKRNHNGKPIIITNDDIEKKDKTDNYFYWVDRRLLSIHEVFGKETDLGFVDLDLHGDYSFENAKKYAKEVSKKIKEKYGAEAKIYNSGGTGIHIEFKLDEKQSINNLRSELKELLDEINENWDNVTTGIVKGTGMRSDVSTLHNKGSLRVPGSLGETYGKEKKQIVESESNDLEYGLLNIQNEAFEESGAISPAAQISNEGIEPYSYASKRLQAIWKIAEIVGDTRPNISEKRKRELEEAERFLREHSGELGEEGELFGELTPGRKKKKKNKDPESFGELASKPGVVSLFKEDDKKKKKEEEKPESSWYSNIDLKNIPSGSKKVDLPKKPPRSLSVRQMPEVGLKETEVEEENYDDFGFVEPEEIIILTPVEICEIEGDWVVPCDEVYKMRHIYEGTKSPIESSVSTDISGIEKEEIKNKSFVPQEHIVEKKEITDEQIEEMEVNPNSDSVIERLPKDTDKDAVRLMESNPSIAIDPTSEQYVDDDDDGGGDVDLNEENIEDLLGEDFDLDSLMEETISEQNIKKKLRYGGDLLEPPSKKVKLSDGSEKNVILSEWPKIIDSTEGLKEANVSTKVALYFQPLIVAFKEEESVGKELRKLFLDETGNVWEILKKEPHVVQSYILPYLINILGKAWFDNNKSLKRMGGAPFGLWGNEEDSGNFIRSLDDNKIKFEETPEGKSIIAKINETVTKYANNYFAMHTANLPIDKYIYDYLDKDMKRWIADWHGYKEKKLMVCAICRSERFENGIDAAMKREGAFEADPEFGKMVRLESKSKVSLWECPNCRKRVEDISYEINAIDTKIDTLENEVGLFDQKATKTQDEIDSIDFKKVELNDLQERKKLLVQSRNKYANQLRAPRMHTWCPNNECPGQRVPLTAIDWDNDFWSTEEGKEIVPKLISEYGIEVPEQIKKLVKIQNNEDYIYRNKNKHKRIPDSWMLNVPFVCPYDGEKFTLESAKNKGIESRGGYLWDPWQKSFWKSMGDAMSVSFEDSGIEPETKSEVEETLDNYKISELARKILILKYWDKRQEFLSSASSKFNSFESAIKNKSVMGQFRNLALYDSLLSFSSYDNLAYSGWLCNKEIIKRQSKLGNNIGDTRKLDRNIKETKREEVLVPVLQKWIQTMLSRGKNWREGFDKYNLSSWLVNEKQNGIKSEWEDTVGTFFVAQVNNGMFEINLQDVGEKERESSRLRLAKVLNVYKINKKSLLSLTEDELSGKVDIKEESKINDLAEDLTEDLSSFIIDYNFYKGNIETNSSLLTGDYVLIHGLVISGQYDHPAIKAIREIRTENDEDNLFEQLGELIVYGVDNPKIWNEVKKLASKKEKLLEKDFQNQLENLKELVEKEISFRKEDVPLTDEEIQELEKVSGLSIRAADPLKKYKSKRDFDETSEPEGNVSDKNQHRFVIQSHHAEKAHHHFDLRLENDEGVLQSWAIPKHKMPEGKEKLLAMQTEDHPIEYMKFKGEIEEGYGKGKVEIWASGKYEPIEFSRDKIIFKVNSGKSKGQFVLFRTDGKKWMLMRKKEEN